MYDVDPSWSDQSPPKFLISIQLFYVRCLTITNSSSVKALLIVPGGRDGAWLEEQKKSGRNVSRHVELANQEPARIFRKTMTSEKSERKAQRSCMTVHNRCRSINVLTFTFWMRYLLDLCWRLSQSLINVFAYLQGMFRAEA